MSESKREAHGIGINLLTLLAQAALPAFHVQLARFLHDSGYGVYTWSNTFVDMFSLLTLFGMDQAVARHVALAYAEKDDRGAVVATGTALRVVLLSGLLISGALFFAAPFVAARQGKPELITPLRLLAVTPIFYHATTIFLVATQARGVMTYNFWVRGLVQPLGLLALTSLALRRSPTVAAACLAVGAGMALTTVAAAYFYSRQLSLADTLRAAARGPVDRALLHLAVPLVAVNLIWSLQGRIDALLLGHYRSTAEMGAYAACVLYVTSISQLRGAFDPVVCAAIPAALQKGDIAGLTATIQRQTRWVALGAVPLAVLFGGFGGGLLSVFGHGFERGAYAMMALSVGHLVNALSLAAYVIPMSGNPRFGAIAAGLSVGLQAVLLPLLLPRLGLTGAAISAAAGLVTAQTFQMVFAYRLTRVHGMSVGLARIGLCGVGALAVGRQVYGMVPGPLAARFFGGVGVAGVVYLALIVAFGLEPAERERLLQLALRLVRRRPR